MLMPKERKFQPQLWLPRYKIPLKSCLGIFYQSFMYCIGKTNHFVNVNSTGSLRRKLFHIGVPVEISDTSAGRKKYFKIISSLSIFVMFLPL